MEVCDSFDPCQFQRSFLYLILACALKAVNIPLCVCKK